VLKSGKFYKLISIEVFGCGKICGKRRRCVENFKEKVFINDFHNLLKILGIDGKEIRFQRI
jgi:hypothetical protein